MMFRKLKTNIRINVLLGLFVMAIMLTLLIISDYHTRKYIRNSFYQEMETELNGIDRNITEINNKRGEQIQADIEFAYYYFRNQGDIQTHNKTLTIDAVNQVTRKRVSVEVPQWTLSGQLVQGNQELAQNISAYTGTQVAVLQKIPRGYIRVASSITTGQQDYGTYVPNSSVVVETIERGQRYTGRAFVYDQWYHASYIPLIIDEKVQGMLFVGMPQLPLEYLRNVFSTRTYRGNAFFWMMDKKGNVLLHRGHEGENFSQKSFFEDFIPVGVNVRHFQKAVPTQDGKTTEYNYFYKYNKTIDAYFIIQVPHQAFLAEMGMFRRKILWPAALLISLFIVAIFFASRPEQQALELINNRLGKMAKGQLPPPIQARRKDEIGQIITSVNAVQKFLNHVAHFAQEIRQGNFQAQYEPASKEDEIGHTLQDMRKSLIDAKKAEDERQRISQEQQWLNQGIAEFSELLRTENRDTEKLARKVIAKLVTSMNAHQGGFFVLKEEQESNEIEMVASYAFGKQRLLQKTIPYGVGLVGRSIQEKKLLHINEIPEGYPDISSGLGQAQPKDILVFPLVANNQTLGAVEMNTLHGFKDIHLEFAKKIAESIAITLITVQSNTRTEELLRNSKRQAEELASQEEEMRQNLEELQATQEAAARRETEMQSIIEALNSTNLVIHFDINGVIEDVNQNMLNLLAANEDELVGLTIDYLIPAHKKEEHIKRWERVKKGQMVSRDILYVFRNRRLSVTETLTPIADEEGNYYKVLSISAKKSIQLARLKDSEEKQEE